MLIFELVVTQKYYTFVFLCLKVFVHFKNNHAFCPGWAEGVDP